MDADLKSEVIDIADLRAQKYCRMLAEEAVPRMIETALSAHDSDIEAHGGLQMKTAQTRWAVRGMIALLLIMGGAGIERVFGLFF